MFDWYEDIQGIPTSGGEHLYVWLPGGKSTWAWWLSGGDEWPRDFQLPVGSLYTDEA